MKIGVLNGGGDCAGLNAVIAAVVKSGSRDGHEFVGIIKGLEGLLGDHANTMPLDLNTVDGITPQGGTILYTTNKGRFSSKVGAGGVSKIPDEIIAESKKNIQKLGLDCLIVIGGDGTLSSALQLHEAGVNIVGVPKTIDNDLKSTDKTFGFSSAVDFVADAVDRIDTTAESHNRVIFIETMGRHAGWIALYGGVAGAANMILLPEIPYNYEKVINHLRQRQQMGKNSSIVVVAEGAKAEGEDQAVKKAEKNKENQIGGITHRIMEEISARTGDEFEMRNVVLGHLQRGGSPNAEDRVLSLRYGVGAINLVNNRDWGKMVSLKNGQISSVKIADAVKDLNLITEDDPMLQTARDLGVYLGV